jgi:hypothetical protein
MRELEDANVRGREFEEGWSFLESRTIDPDRKEAWSRPPTIERPAILWAHLVGVYAFDHPCSSGMLALPADNEQRN